MNQCRRYGNYREVTMAKKAKFRSIKNTRYYNPSELAYEIGLRVETVYAHIRLGLEANKETVPYIIYGRDAKRYFTQLYSTSVRKKCKDEVICHGCQGVFNLRSVKTECLFTGRYYNDTIAQVQVTGLCTFCQRKFSRFKSMKAVQGMKAGASVPIENIITKEEKNEA
jgi:hypothetical protein